MGNAASFFKNAFDKLEKGRTRKPHRAITRLQNDSLARCDPLAFAVTVGGEDAHCGSPASWRFGRIQSARGKWQV